MGSSGGTGGGTGGSERAAGRAAGRQTIGPYRLDGEIGRGTSGIVHRATDLRDPSGRPLALKRLGLRADAEERRRFEREAAVMLELQHPAITRILDVVDDEDGIAIVMDLAVGGSLRDRLRAEHSVAVRELADVIAPIADALDAAHRRGIIHRDVKPGNILFDDEGRPSLTDFGIARTGDGTELTRTDTALGTAAYLAPEVADGADHSPATDLYGLGVTAYEALSGELPFRGATPLAVLRAADRGAFTPLDRATVGRVADVVERAMARQPADRHPSAAAFADDLRRAVGHGSDVPRSLPDGVDRPSTATAHGAAGSNAGADEPVRVTTRLRRSRPEPLPEATARPARRSPRILIAAAIAVALSVGGIVVAGQRRSGSSGVVAFRPTCTPSATVRCLSRVERTDDRLVVSFVGDAETIRIDLDEPGDVALAGNWFCGPTETLALYRPRDGTIRYFKSWPTVTDDAVPSVGDRTGIIGGKVMPVGDHNDDGCSDVAIESFVGDRTWFLPVIQPNRLEPLT